MVAVMLWLEPPCLGEPLETCDYVKRNTAVGGGTASEPPGKKEIGVEEMLIKDLISSVLDIFLLEVEDYNKKHCKSKILHKC